MEYPPVTVIITTYDPGHGRRFELAKVTLKSLIDNLRYDNLCWIIADDSNKGILPLDEFGSILEGKLHTYTFSERSGVGRSKNIALQKAFETSPYVLLLEDDWKLKYPLDLYHYVHLMQENTSIGMVRFGFLGGDMTAQLVSLCDRTYWKLLRGSGVYIYSGQVSIRHKRFYDSVGYHLEGLDAGQEELEYCKLFNGVEGAPDILWDAQFGSTLNAGPFENIGLNESVNAVQPGE